jgi:hypothetical protein
MGVPSGRSNTLIGACLYRPLVKRAVAFRITPSHHQRPAADVRLAPICRDLRETKSSLGVAGLTASEAARATGAGEQTAPISDVDNVLRPRP